MSSPEDAPLGGDTSTAELDRVALAGAAITGVLSFTPVADAPGSVFIAGACLFWAAFVVVRARQDRSVFRRWGFRADNLLQASVMPVVVFIIGAAGLAAFAWLHSTFRFPPHALLLFPVYSVWGLFQQLLMLGIFTQALERVEGLRRRRGLLVLLVALVFGLIHAVNLKLVAATFVLELLIVPLYLRYRNLWPLGALHGWLGGLFYLWILDRDLWIERFG